MKWQKVYKIYQVSEDSLLKEVKDHYRYRMFDNWYSTEEQAIEDIKRKTEGDLIDFCPDELHIIPVMVKVLA